MQYIRRIEERDIEGLKQLIDSNDLFPSSMLDDMVARCWEDNLSQRIWLTKEERGTYSVIAFYAPETLTEGTYNLYLIAVHKDFQGNGLGSEMMEYIEAQLRLQCARVLIVETSGLPEFELIPFRH